MPNHMRRARRFASVLLVVLVAGCTRYDPPQTVCANQGFYPGTVEYDECLRQVIAYYDRVQAHHDAVGRFGQSLTNYGLMLMQGRR